MSLGRILVAGAVLLVPAVASADLPAPPPAPPAPVAPPAVAPPAAAPPSAPLAPRPMPMPAPYVPTMRMGRHSEALMAGGIAMTTLGVLSVAGGVTAIIADSGHGDFDGVLAFLVGLPLLIHGAGCIAGGIPMIVIGNKQIPIGYAGAKPSPVPHVSVGKGTGRLTWRF